MALNGPFTSGAPERARVVFRLRPGVQVPERGDLTALFGDPESLLLADLTRRFGKLAMQRSVRSVTTARLQELIEEAQRRDPTYKPGNLQNYVHIDAPAAADLQALADALAALPGVELAYVDRGASDPVVNAADDPRSASQGYLDPAPDGIDAELAWSFPGGDGAGQRFIDIERGWTLNHEDLAAHGARLLAGTLYDFSRPHGTAVLGELCAVDNTVGCVGIVPNVASVNVVSYHDSTLADAILTAIAHLSFGDVLLIEAQVVLNDAILLGPVEANDAEFDAIRLATALGIIVVEAGGNGTRNGNTPALDMDNFVDRQGRRIFDVRHPDFRDSGAIIVTAATSTSPHTRLAWAPYGQRIDCYAWGENVATCSSSSSGATDMYTSGFGGTSGASPIVTGAILAIQGIVEAAHGFRYSPLQMRAILRSPANGTAPAATETTRIGGMPNLRAVVQNVLNLAPDVYLRDFVGDSGEPHTGWLSTSPDVIVRPSPVADPRAAYGPGSGTENDEELGYEVEAGQDNYIYVRVLNQGGTTATNVRATVYWSQVSTLVTPDLWNEIGSVLLPSVPTGSILTVSDAIVWPAAGIPATGHYCFVATVGTPDDPPPTPGELLNWANFERFIRENNNVTWRNFNVVDNDPLSSSDPLVPKDFIELPFIAAGAPDIARPMQLEVLGFLPQEAVAYIDMPLDMAERAQLLSPAAVTDAKTNRVRMPLNPTGRSRSKKTLFPARARYDLRLLVQIPKEARRHAFQIAVRQLHEQTEVGRVTWRLAPGVRKRQREARKKK